VPLILIVEDDLTTNRMLEAILQRAGFRTACAFDAGSALVQVRGQNPDLILLDVTLPDGNGFDICRQIQTMQGSGQTPVLFISSHDQTASKVQGFEAGGVDYIPKPLAGEEVIARVSTHLRLKQAYEDLAELHAERIKRLAVAQEMLMPLPHDLPEARFQITLQQVLKAGGDFYDVISVGPGIFDYVVADTAGHDLASSFWTAALKTLLAQYAAAANSPMEILRSINNTLRRVLPEGVFFTVCYARVNRKMNRLWIASAGHPPAILFPSNGSEPIIFAQQADVLGAFEDAVFDAVEHKVRPGDRFFLYSDGLIELQADHTEGLTHLTQACAGFRNVPIDNSVPGIVQQLTTGVTAQDDIMLMGVEI
jgi:sigma-B regulation protein RsbU (phosphoserine phosphatase)